MKIPAIRQLPSGMYFCQLRLDGRSISITDEDRDVVEAKAYAYKSGILNLRKTPKNITVGDALKQYIELRRNILSPSTIRGYMIIYNNRLKSLQSRPISSLTAKIVQRDINAEANLCSAKTLRNAYMLFASAIKEAGGEEFDIRLPQVMKAEIESLDPEQVPVLLSAIKGHPYEIPILLGLWSCRRSEIYGLTWDNIDLKKRQIHIVNTLVPDDTHKFVEKSTTKTRSSRRVIPMSDQLYEALNAIPDKTGYVVKGSPETLRKKVNAICRANDLPEIGTHGLRHSFASLAYSLGIPPKVTMQIGGWENDAVMLRIYTHISKKDVEASAANILDYFNQNANGNANKNDQTA